MLTYKSYTKMETALNMLKFPLSFNQFITLCIVLIISYNSETNDYCDKHLPGVCEPPCIVKFVKTCNNSQLPDKYCVKLSYSALVTWQECINQADIVYWETGTDGPVERKSISNSFKMDCTYHTQNIMSFKKSAYTHIGGLSVDKEYSLQIRVTLNNQLNGQTVNLSSMTTRLHLFSKDLHNMNQLAGSSNLEKCCRMSNSIHYLYKDGICIKVFSENTKVFKQICILLSCILFLIVLLLVVLHLIDPSIITKKRHKRAEENIYQSVSRSESMMYNTLLKSQVRGVRLSPNGKGDTIPKWLKRQSI